MDWIVGLCNLGALAVVIVLFILRIPSILAYVEAKDKRHEERVDKIIEKSRLEREQFYTNLKDINIRLDDIDDKIDDLISQKT
jgi:hypothetical protein